MELDRVVLQPLSGSLWSAHSILFTIAVMLLLPIGVYLARIRSWLHKPWQFVSALILTVAAAVGHFAHVATHQAMHEPYRLDGFHSVLGWILIGMVWVQVALGSGISSWNRFVLSDRKQFWRGLHRPLGWLLFPLLWIQLLSGMYAILHVSNSSYANQMWANTTVGIFFVAMGIYYLSAAQANSYVESGAMIFGGTVLFCTEIAAMQHPPWFLQNPNVLVAFLWVSCGLVGLLVNSLSFFFPAVKDVPALEQTESSVPPAPVSFPFLPVLLAVIIHVVYILLNVQPLENSNLLYRLHALFLIIGLIFRGMDMLPITGSCVILSGILFVCAQSGLCFLAMELQVLPVVWALLSIVIGIWSLLLVILHLKWFGM